VELIVRIPEEGLSKLNVGARFRLVHKVVQRAIEGSDFLVLVEFTEDKPEPVSACHCHLCRPVHEPTSC
jgi:hypothetical protein